MFMGDGWGFAETVTKLVWIGSIVLDSSLELEKVGGGHY